jgi:hypothetical protein
MDGITARNFTVNGVPTSLSDLGFKVRQSVSLGDPKQGGCPSPTPPGALPPTHGPALTSPPSPPPTTIRPRPATAPTAQQDVGLDDNWQLCGSYGPNKYTFHTEAGFPMVNTDRFPDFIAMTSYAHSKGLTAGWYGNNCM